MKTKIILFLLLFISFSGINAQNQFKTYHQKMKVLTSDLDSTKFKNNILYDRVFPLAKLNTINQNGRTDTITSRIFIQAAHELYMASNKKVLKPTELLEQSILHAKMHNKVPIGILNVDFTSINQNAFDDNNKKMEIDSTSNVYKLKEIPNKIPYENKQALLVSVLSDNVELQNGQPTIFSFKEAFLQKSTNPIKTLQVDFGDGTLQTIIDNRRLVSPEISHNFAQAGLKTIRFTGVYNDNTHFTTFSNLHLRQNTQSFPGNISPVYKIRATELFTPYTPDVLLGPNDTFTETERHAEIEYQIFYSLNPYRNTLQKPVIIVDGIDYNDMRKTWHIYGMMQTTDTHKFLGTELRQLGYDVVIVNFPNYKIGTKTVEYATEYDDYGNPEYTDYYTLDVFIKGGADYIQRNAKGLKQLIRVLNNQLQANGSSEQMVLIGPSMGGLVTRWALKEMEDSGENHNVRLWVSFDAPHQGANVPTAFQFISQHLDNFAALDMLKRAASKEMLVKHYLDVSNGTVYGGAPGFRNRFNNELRNLGYPQVPRKIAVVNGSFMGQEVNQPGQEILYTHLWMDSAPWSDVLRGHLYFSNNSGIKNVIHFNYTNVASWLGGYSDMYRNVFSASDLGSYDNAPGCTFPLPNFNQEFDNEPVGLWIYLDGYVHQYVNNFSFIPTKSALGFTGSHKLLRESLCSTYGNLVQENVTPFDSYYAPVNNEEHIELTSANTNWLLQEIQGNPQLPYPGANLCNAPLTLTGPGHLCPNQPATYHINTNQTVNWLLDGLTEISRTNNSITVTKNNQLDLSCLTAVVNNTPYKKYIICEPIIDPIHHGNGIALRTGNDNVPLDQQGITDVTWHLTHGTGTILSADNNHADIDSEDYYGEVTVTNDGGSVTKTFFGPNPDKCYIIKKAGTDKYQVIDRCNGYVPVASMPIKEIYNEFGNKIQDAPVINDKIDVSNSGNTGDIRIIRVIVNGENVSKIIVKD